ncbi:MAG TPA: uroporphyrinogen-III synthase [Kofleriaceae bacterium]|nr:uroporphyrinogen-III synthase [Kofleriaceae bacterium]
MASAVVTREPALAAPYLQALAQLGLSALAMPVTATVPVEPATLEAALRTLGAGDVVALASARGAALLAAALARLEGQVPRAALRWWAVGESTAAPLRRLGLAVEVPQRATADGLADAIVAAHHATVQPAAQPAAARWRVLLPRAEDGRPEAALALRAAGARVDEVVVYRTVSAAAGEPALAEPLARWRAGQVAVAALFAPSQVSALGAILAGAGLHLCDPAVLYAAIGETTANALRAAAVTNLVVAPHPTPEALASVIAARLPRSG